MDLTLFYSLSEWWIFIYLIQRLLSQETYAVFLFYNFYYLKKRYKLIILSYKILIFATGIVPKLQLNIVLRYSMII